MNILPFFRNKHIFITGHSGFKGSWLCRILINSGAIITGFSLPAPQSPNLFELSNILGNLNHKIGDIRNFTALKSAFDEAQPEIVIHLAAQPIVRDSYIDPLLTYQTNVMGTVNLLECLRLTNSVKSFLNVTTDKVYLNKEWDWGYRENEELNGFDPYSNSKSCSELVTQSYKNCFFANNETRISTARAGNVIGGGDFAHDRIIPDCVRAMQSKTPIAVRNPHSTRPYQHVLEPLVAYLLILEAQWQDPSFAGSYNVGPNETDCINTGQLVDMFCQAWGDGATWENLQEANAPHEANFLKLDCSKLKNKLGWSPHWSAKIAVEKSCEWYQAWLNGEDCSALMDKQINEYLMKH